MVPCLTTIKRGAKYAGTRYLHSQCDIDYEDRIAPWPSFAGDKCLFFYLLCLSSIHEKANCIAIFWTGRPHALGSCHF